MKNTPVIWRDLLLKALVLPLLVSTSMCVAGTSRAATAPVAPARTPESHDTHYRKVQVDGLSIFYREAGPKNAPTLLLLHGFPSSSRMYEPLIARLSAKYHLIAPDYPGFGHSDAPTPDKFHYTFDNLATVIEHFTDAIGLNQYVLYMQDYGGPVGMRLAISRPERVRAFIVQNAVSHDEGLGPLWEKRKAFWANRATYEPALRSAFLSLDAAKARHVGSNPLPDTLDPDRWTDEFAHLSLPGQADIQTDLFFDYRTNVSSYASWGKWLREHQPRSLVVWGKYDSSFEVDEVKAYQRDVPKADVHVIDAGHFAINDKPEEISRLVSSFMEQLPKP